MLHASCKWNTGWANVAERCMALEILDCCELNIDLNINQEAKQSKQKMCLTIILIFSFFYWSQIMIGL